MTGSGISNMVADLLIAGADISRDDTLSNAIIILAGFLVLTAGIYFFRKNMKSAAIFSFLIILSMMSGVFVIKMISESDIWVEFLGLAIVSAAIVAVIYTISLKTGAYDEMKELDIFNIR
ncbi:MAG: hypothetical protein AB7S83_03330 [Candidatus Methanomethylophilaceae archaeon]